MPPQHGRRRTRTEVVELETAFIVPKCDRLSVPGHHRGHWPPLRAADPPHSLTRLVIPKVYYGPVPRNGGQSCPIREKGQSMNGVFMPALDAPEARYCSGRQRALQLG